MRRFLITSLLLCFAVPSLFAQGGFTTVTGTITDPNGLKYSCGTISAQLITAGGASATLNGGGFTTQTSPIGLGCPTTPGTGANGSFAMRLADSGVINPSNTTWKFTVNMTPGIAPPAGTGPQSFTVTTAINCSTNTPATCTSNQMDISTLLSGSALALAPVTSGLQQGTVNPSCVAGQAFLFLNTATNQLLSCNNGVLSTASGSPATTIDMKQFGVVADLRTCIGTAVTFTNGSPNLTCTTGAFCNGTTVACPAGQTSDVGKRINATNGCCNSSPPVNANTQALPINTTILSVTDATHIVVSNNFTLSSSVSPPNGYVFWATDDEANVSAADAAYQAAPACTALLWPATAFLVRGPHFNVAPPQCEQLESGGGVGRIATANYIGWGSNNSVMYLDSAFNFAGCTFGANNNGCFFSMAGAHLQHLGISGGWNQVPNGGGHNVSLVNPNSSAEFLDARFVGFGSGEGSSTIGFSTNSGFSIYRSVYVEGFGFITCSLSGNITEFDGGYCGNSQGASLSIGNGPIWMKNTSVGKSGTTTMNVTNPGGPFYSIGNYYYGGAGTGINLNSNSVMSFSGDTIGAQGGFTTAILDNSNGGVQNVIVRDSVISSTSTAVQTNTATSRFVDACGNTFNGAGTFTVVSTSTYQTCPGSIYANQTGLVPTCAFSTGGGTSPSCALQAGSVNEHGVIIATTGTGSPGSSGTITLTFAGTFTGPTGAAPACVFTLDNSGTAWGAEAVAFTNTQSTTAPTMAWTNIAAVTLTALTASSPYRIDYSCLAR